MNKQTVFLVFLVLGITAFAEKSHYFLQISDQHLEWQYREGSDPKKDWCRSTTPGTAGHYGDYGCHSPEALLEAHLIDSTKRFPKPDFIFWTGDMRRGFAAVGGNDEILFALKNTTLQLRKAYPGVHVFPVLGNHDIHPDNLHGAERAPLYQKIALLWHDWLDTEAQKTFGKGAYYVRHMDSYSVIVLNTCMYIKFDTLTAHMDDPAGQLAWLQSVFSSFPKERFYVIGHCPIHEDMYDTHRNKLLSIVRKYHMQIEALFMGHFHTDLTGLIFDSTGTTPLFIQYCSPSIATRPGGIHGGHNPSYRVYYRHVVDDKPQMILDSYETYYLPLAEANKKLKGDFYFEYGSNDGNFTGLDIVPPITADKWYKTLNNVFKDSHLVHELYNRYNVNTVTSSDVCDATCIKTLRCSYLYLADNDQYKKCMA